MVAAAQSYTVGNASVSTTLVLNKPTGVVSGDLMLAEMVASATSTWTAPAGWTPLATSAQGATFWRIAGGSEGASYTFTQSASLTNAYGRIVRFTGHDPVTPVAASAAALPSASTVDSPSVTATGGNTLLFVSCILPASSSLPTAPTGTTQYQNEVSGQAIASAYKTVAAGATGAQTWTLAGPTTAGVSSVAINSAGVSASATITETATLTATGQVATSTSATETITATLTGTGGAGGASSLTTTAGITATGSAGSTAQNTIAATLTASGTVPSGAAQNITATLTASGTAGGSGDRSTTVAITATGAGSSAPTRTTTATLTATGGATSQPLRMVTATLTADGVVAGIAITANKRPLVMDRGLVREFQDTDVLVGGGISRTFPFFGG